MARGTTATPKPLASEKKEPSLASTALDNIPADALTRRREFLDHMDSLISTAKEKAADVGAHKKRLTETFMVEKAVLGWLKDMRKMGKARGGRALRQFMFFLKDFDLTEDQLSLFNDDGQPGGLTNDKDDKPIFDKTGNKAAPQERREPEKKMTGSEPPPHVPSEGIPLDQAQAEFQKNKEAGDAKRAAAKAPALAKPPSAAADPAPAAKPKLSLVKPPVVSSPTPTAKTTRLTRPPSDAQKAEARAKADKYFKPGEGAAKDDDKNDPAGDYKVH